MAHSHLLQDHLQWAEVGERRLQEVEPDKGGEPQPIEAVEVSQQKADQDEHARKSPEDHFHKYFFVYAFLLPRREAEGKTFHEC